MTSTPRAAASTAAASVVSPRTSLSFGPRSSIVERLNLSESGGMVRVGPVHYNTLDEIEEFGQALSKLAILS